MEANLMRFVNSLVMKIHPLHGWCSYEKGQRLALLAIEMNAQKIVEVGVFGGRSLIPMALACKFKGSGVVHGIDPWEKDAALEGKNDQTNDDWWGNVVDLNLIYNSYLKSIVNYGLQDQCVTHKMKSIDAINLFEDRSIDIFHQDSNHSEEVSCSEVEKWMPKMKISCAWICDDTNWPTIQKSLRLIESYGFETVQQYENWKIYKRG